VKVSDPVEVVYRYERKFLVPGLTLEELETIIHLHPAMFSPLYHERRVNNIYFDDMELKHFYDNVDGTSERVKVRLRWYGDLDGRIESPVLEIKRKSGFVGTKDYLPVEDIVLQNGQMFPDILAPLRTKNIPEKIQRELILMEPTLINRYTRKYFLSANGQFRMTLDNGIQYFRPDLPYPSFLEYGFNDSSLILELKYNEELDDEAEAISNHFPFRVTKSSKYVTGMIKLFAME
jgi:hypothetical protein